MVRRIFAGLMIGIVIVPVLLVVFCYVLGLMAVHDDPWLQADIRTWQAAYPALAALPDFDWVSDQPDGSWLLHRYGEPDQAAALPEEIADMLHGRDLLGLRKTGDDVFFITAGAVDDEWGYVLTGDGSVCMDGLVTLERVGNGVFRFSTRK